MPRKERTSRHHKSSPRSWRVMQSLQTLSPETKRALGVIGLWTLAVLVILSLMGLAGTAGSFVARYIRLAFGEGPSYLFPIILFLLGAALYRRPNLPFQGIQFFGLIFFILSFFAFWHLQYSPEESLERAFDGLGGGLAGFVFAASFQTVIGFWGALFVLIAVCISSMLIVLNTSFHVFIAALTRVLGQIGKGFSIGVHQLFSRPASETVRVRIQRPDDDDDEDTPGFVSKRIEHAVADREEEDEKSKGGAPSGDAMEVRALPKKKQRVQLSIDLLNLSSSKPTSGDIKLNKIVVQKTFENFGIPVEMGEVNVGPTVTQFTLKPAEGVKVASIIGLHNDLALALAAHPIRIEAPIPGKSLVGIEVPNQKVAIVTLRELLESETFKKRKNNLHFTLGKDVSGTVRLANVATMPHLLIAGSTGSGKTVCINTLIMSLLFQNSADDLRFIMVDPKRVELPCYNDIPHLLTPVVTDVKKAINALKWAIGEMERRYSVLAAAGKRDLASYNVIAPERMPYIVIVIDELADMMVTVGPEAETLIIRLAQMARAVGIHLVLATQRPSTDVITGLIKANITSRIAFAVASQIDSRTILDTGGAERLIGRGDMLYICSELSKPVRIQGAYVSDEEIDRVVSFLKETGEPSYTEGVTEKAQSNMGGLGGDDDDEDDLLPEAREIILQAHKASASLLQRRLRIGYARAARILDLLEVQGFIGPGDGARPRELLVQSPEELDMMGPPREDDEYEDYPQERG